MGETDHEVASAAIVPVEVASCSGASNGATRSREEQRDSSPKQKKARNMKGSTKVQAKMDMTRKAFLEAADAITVQIGENKMKVESRKFSTGSVGFYNQQKIVLNVGGQDLTLQCQINCTVLGSKEWVDE